MNALTTAGWTVRATGLALIALGLLLWVDVAAGLRSIHMLIGIVLVAALLPIVAIAWGFVVVALGMTQAQLLPGDAHVVVEVAHLLVGVVAIGLGEALVAAGRRGAGVPA